ncbi:hypothetical protein [Halochromatium sp.]
MATWTASRFATAAVYVLEATLPSKWVTEAGLGRSGANALSGADWHAPVSAALEPDRMLVTELDRGENEVSMDRFGQQKQPGHQHETGSECRDSKGRDGGDHRALH